MAATSAPDFYLVSSEGYGIELPRAVWRQRDLKTPHRADLVLVRVDPPLRGQEYGLRGDDIELLLLAHRHRGYSLNPITEWPAYVHVARLLTNAMPVADAVEDGDFEEIGWAELYRTLEDVPVR